MLNLLLNIVSLLCLFAWILFLAAALVVAILVPVELGRMAIRKLQGIIVRRPAGGLAAASDAQFQRDIGIKR